MRVEKNNDVVLPKLKKEKKVKVKKKKHHYFLAFILILVNLILIAACGFVGYFIYYIVSNAPDFDKRELYYKQSTIIYDKKGNELTRLGQENREAVTYDDLPQVLIDAIVATEDARFFSHNGFDAMRFIRASYQHFQGDDSAGGASTIPMQISKNIFTSNVATGVEGIVRKFTDIYMSIFKIEKELSKEEIMELYVNLQYLGSGAYGVETASQVYFGKSVRDLTLSEAALIAGLFQAPSDTDPYIHLFNATKRRNEVLNLMYKHGYITQEELNDQLSVPVNSLLCGQNKLISKYQGFIDTVVEEVIADTGLNPYDVPMIIYSTMDTKVQNAINKVMSNKNNFKDNAIQAGIAVTSTKDGSVMGIGASRKVKTLRQFNYATMINRQPGSAIKPFMDYGPLFEYSNTTPYTTIVDEPYHYSDGGSIFNAARDYKGTITIKQALAESRNIPALKAFQSISKTKISNYVHSFGIDYGKYLYESASIGAFEGVSPLTMSAAYGAYARGGYYIEPYSYTKIIYRSNDEVLEKKPEKVKVCSKKTAKYINDILTYAIKYQQILGSLPVGSTQVAGKTGTTTIDRSFIRKLHLPESTIMDTWGCIYSKEYSTALWYGYDKITKKHYTVPWDGTLGRRRILKKLSRAIYNTGSSLITSSSSFMTDD